jgi:hypothetical protein
MTHREQAVMVECQWVNFTLWMIPQSLGGISRSLSPVGSSAVSTTPPSAAVFTQSGLMIKPRPTENKDRPNGAAHATGMGVWPIFASLGDVTRDAIDPGLA